MDWTKYSCTGCGELMNERDLRGGYRCDLCGLVDDTSAEEAQDRQVARYEPDTE